MVFEPFNIVLAEIIAGLDLDDIEHCRSRVFDPVFGARPLRRAVQRHLENLLSKAILADEFGEGDHVVVDGGDSGLTLTKAAATLSAG